MTIENGPKISSLNTKQLGKRTILKTFGKTEAMPNNRGFEKAMKSGKARRIPELPWWLRWVDLPPMREIWV